MIVGHACRGLEVQAVARGQQLALPEALLVREIERRMRRIAAGRQEGRATYAETRRRMVRHPACPGPGMDQIPAAVVVAACREGQAGRQVERTADDCRATLVAAEQLLEPAWCGDAVGIDEDDRIAATLRRAEIPGRRSIALLAGLGGLDDPGTRGPRQPHGVVGGTVVDDDHLDGLGAR